MLLWKAIETESNRNYINIQLNWTIIENYNRFSFFEIENEIRLWNVNDKWRYMQYNSLSAA